MLNLRALSFLLALLLVLPVSQAETRGADPAINRPYLNPDYKTWVKRFESPGREIYDRREAIVQASGVGPGMRVADIGAGTGLFTLLFAKAVGPSGQIVAVDISETFLDAIQARAQHEKLANVSTQLSTQTEARLAPGSVHLVFLCDTYHHFEHPAVMLDSIHRALKPGGTLVVIDFERIEGKSSAWVLDHVRAGKEAVIREIEAAGFKLLADEPLLKENFFLRFEKQIPRG
jgi:ubiquinone/menaquinone biosynthesis C-methylase UbiE